MAGHQDARYIPPRRERDNPRRGRDGFFSIRWVVLAAVVVTLVVIFLIVARAEQTAKLPMIGYFHSDGQDASAFRVAAFRYSTSTFWPSV